MAKQVAIYSGVDSGGTLCPCKTPPYPLTPSVGNVFGNKFAVMVAGHVLTPAQGSTAECTIIPVPCVSPRVVVNTVPTKVFVNKVPIATVGAILSVATGITVPPNATTIFV